MFKMRSKRLLLDQLIIEILKLLQAVFVFQKFFDRAILLVEDVLNRGATLVAITAPKSTI